MESKMVSEVQGIVLTMDIREALRFLVDSGQAQEHVRGQLVGHSIDVPEGNGRPRKARAAKAGETKCNRCGGEFKSVSGLNHHITVMHPETLKDKV